MTPMTAAGRALLEQYPELEPMVYGLTDEPIVEAIEREAAAHERERIVALWDSNYISDDERLLRRTRQVLAILAEPSE